MKKRIVRTLIHEIVVDVDAEAGELILDLHWKGGVHTELRLPRRRRGQNSKQTSKEIVDAVRMLARICSDEVIAGALNRNGLLTGRGNRWTKEGVSQAAIAYQWWQNPLHACSKNHFHTVRSEFKSSLGIANSARPQSRQTTIIGYKSTGCLLTSRSFGKWMPTSDSNCF